MNMSPFFQTLGSAYQAEIDDLTFDSEGHDVLSQRLADKRKELTFLRQMIEFSPEMVAVVFHQGFLFKQPNFMDDLVRRKSDELPAWDSLANVLALRPWAQDLAKEILKEPMGAWLMTVAAGLEYLYGKPGRPLAANDDADDGDSEDDQDDRDDEPGDDQYDGDGDARSREEAGQDWMEQQGFDRKDR